LSTSNKVDRVEFNFVASVYRTTGLHGDGLIVDSHCRLCSAAWVLWYDHGTDNRLTDVDNNAYTALGWASNKPVVCYIFLILLPFGGHHEMLAMKTFFHHSLHVTKSSYSLNK